VKRVTATEAARQFSDLLDAVERTGETFVVERRGRAVANIGPAAEVSGAMVKAVLRSHAVDADWRDELRELRAGLVTEGRHWTG
jgi:prevent-host-death family protein